MLKIKTVNAIPAKAIHNCFLINGAKAASAVPALKSYQTYLKNKSESKKSQIIRLIESNKHIIVMLIHQDGKKSVSGWLEELRVLGHELGKKLAGEKAPDVFIENVKSALGSEEMLCLLEGLILGEYKFNKYKKEKNGSTLKTAYLIGSNLKPANISELSNTLDGTLTARDLVNEPVITLNAPALGREITKLGKKCGFKTRILNMAEIKKLKMGGLLGVNLGSIDPPIFAILEYKPAKAKNKSPYMLVGKGVVYDTGGNNIKVGNNMPTMKSDMGGAAAVIGTMMAVSKNKLPVHVVGLIPATDNRIGKNALVPDDVITISDGSTVEVLNTDAEGRLILADALTYAKKYKPRLVIDLATLTGAAANLTGPLGTAMMGTADEKDKDALKASGDMVYERLAELPFWEEYSDLLKSNVADIKNVGSGYGGAITAGKFLEHFTDYPWIHLDIAGPAFLDGKDGYKSAGGTGVGVRMLYHFLKSRVRK